jgi:hypothetical protein
MHKLAALLCFSATLLTAQTASTPSFFTLTGTRMGDGDGWRHESAYVKGFQDAIEVIVGGFPPETRETTRAKYLAKGFNVGDYIHELDALFADRENQTLILPLAHQYVTWKLSGQMTKAELEQR